VSVTTPPLADAVNPPDGLLAVLVEPLPDPLPAEEPDPLPVSVLLPEPLLLPEPVPPPEVPLASVPDEPPFDEVSPLVPVDEVFDVMSPVEPVPVEVTLPLVIVLPSVSAGLAGVVRSSSHVSSGVNANAGRPPRGRDE
jgi:hypothetical protein